jgi:SAM-dependent methyltransferase
MNLWRSSVVAFAYSYQQNARPYLDLLCTTELYIQPKPGQVWLDLGCGSGRLIRSIWEKSRGQVASITGIDISTSALRVAQRMCSKLIPKDESNKIRFVQADLSYGLKGVFQPHSFHGVTAGLSISYADHWDYSREEWSDISYIGLLRDIYLLLREDGELIFSTNVPNPDFFLIAKRSWREIFLTWKLPLGIAVSLIMLLQARWLKASANVGRFHYLRSEQIVRILREIGFKDIRYKLTYEGQAWVFAATK